VRTSVSSGGSRASSCADEVWPSSAESTLWAGARRGLGPRGRKPWERVRPRAWSGCRYSSFGAPASSAVIDARSRPSDSRPRLTSSGERMVGRHFARSRRRPHRGASATGAFSADGDRVEQLTSGQADAARRGARVRPPGPRSARRRRRTPDHERVPVGRRAGGAVPAASRPEVGRAAGPVAAPLRDRARPGAIVRLRLAGRPRSPVPLHPALRVGTMAL
jgi:hypothetical protein